MSGLGFNPNEYRRVAFVRGLKRRRKLEAVRRHNAVIVIRCGDERGRVARSGLQIMERRVGIQRPELFRVLG